jgi:hypothetical protein
VKRFNYLGPDRVGQAAAALAALREPQLRTPLLAVALVLVSLGAGRAIEDARVARAGEELQGMRERAAAIEPMRRRMHALSTDITRLTQIQAYVHEIRRSGIEHAAELALIGNLLPAHVWLTAIRDVDTGWALSGGARALSDVGTALLALEKIPRTTSTALVSAQASDRDEHAITYEMRLERGR